MNTNLQFFTDYLDKKKITYSITDEDRVSVQFHGEKMSSINVDVIFGDDGEDVAMRAFSIAKVPQEKNIKCCLACSKLNAMFRWVKFYVDDDAEITAAHDAIIDPCTTGSECYKLLMRVGHIVDQAYPLFMKVLWQ